MEIRFNRGHIKRYGYLRRILLGTLSRIFNMFVQSNRLDYLEETEMILRFVYLITVTDTNKYVWKHFRSPDVLLRLKKNRHRNYLIILCVFNK